VKKRGVVAVDRFRGAYRGFDRFQQRHGWLGFVLAVRQKYADDQGGYLAATLTCYAFFAVFPLLLLLVTGLGFALSGDVSLQRRVLHSVLAQFPIIGPQLQHNVHSLRGSGVALFIGIAGSLWAGMGVVLAAQNAMNHLWDVPFRDRPNPIVARVRALVLLLVFGVAGLLATGLASVAGGSTSLGVRTVGVVLSFPVNFLIFWAGFRVLTVRHVGWRDLRLGAAIAAITWALLQALGGYYVTHELRYQTSVYGFFGIVLGLLSWLYVGAAVTLLAAEANVVAEGRLWPRSFSVVTEQAPTSADKRTLTEQSAVEERRHDQDITVTFTERSELAPDGDDHGQRDDEA
jgi:membrane protein